MKNRILLLAFSLLMLVNKAIAQTPPSTFWSGNAVTTWYNGTNSDFTLSTAQELAGLSALVAGGNDFSGKTIHIGGNIDLGAHLWRSIGISVPLSFSGTFDGGNFTISNVFIVDPTGGFIGLFGKCKNARISDVFLNGVYIRTKDTAGSLAGSLGTDSDMENCHATGVDIECTSFNIGGLVGELTNGSTMKRCSSEGAVTGSSQVGGLLGTPFNLTTVSECYSKGTVTAGHLAGGLVGYSTFWTDPTHVNTITNCYSRATVSVTDGRAGGLVGGTDAQMVINNSYATGTATGPEFNGGFIGYVNSVSTLNNYWDEETSALSDAIGGWQGTVQPFDITAKTTAFMKTGAMVTLLNQNQAIAPWTIDPTVNDGYPIFTAANASLSEINKPTINVIVYPSPFMEYIIIESDAALTSYSLLDITGKVVQQETLTGVSSTIDTQSINTGMYFLLVNSDKGSSTNQVVKQ